MAVFNQGIAIPTSNDWVATQDPARAKAVDVESKSERVKKFHCNTLASIYELVGSMGLDDPAKLVPKMVKRRSPYGAQMSIIFLY